MIGTGRMASDNMGRLCVLCLTTVILWAVAVQAQVPIRRDPRPGHVQAMAVVDSLISSSRLEEAVSGARRLLAEEYLDEDLRWQAEQRLGIIYHRMGRLDEALGHLEKASLWAPGVSANHRNLAAVLMELGKPGRAMGELRTAAELDPTDWRLQLDYADILIDFKQFSRAERVMREAEAFCSGCLDVDRTWARLYVTSGNLAAAAPYLEHVQAEEPDRETRQLLAEALLQAGYPDRAREYFTGEWDDGLQPAEMAIVLRADRQLHDSTRAVSLIMGLREGRPAPLPADLWALASSMCGDDGKAEQSLILIERAIELDPRNAVYRNNKVSLLYRLGREEEGDREWEIVIELDPSLAGNRFETPE